MAVIQKTLFGENLDRYNTFVQDTDTNSKYFQITELPDTFTGGKNAFLIQGSQYLVPDTLIKIELKDSAGNIIYHEPGEGIISSSLGGEEFITEYYEGVSKVVAVYIYPETAYGPCTLTILGELSEYENNGLISPIPLNWQGQYNVKWQKQINVNPSLANTTKIRFYKRPTVAVTELLSPIYRIDPISQQKVNSGINQSFADIKISNLETFAGDVKRIKVFRTSLGDISDYNMIQDILVESKELLTSYALTGSVVGNTGILTSETFKNYWITGSLVATLDSNRIESGAKLKGAGNFIYSSSLDLKSANTYEINLDAFYSASTNSTLGIYISSGSYTSSIGTLSGINPTKNLLDTTIPFKLDKDCTPARLFFSQSQGEWHVGNISLKLSQDTAFSPDEVSFVTTMPTVIGDEDFNFKFEFYDVNNNYVPVAVTQSANFTGGSNAVSKLLSFQTDRTAFRFSSGSFANPVNQNVKFTVQRTNFTGSVTYGSSSYDVAGNYIEPSSYAGTYPGWFTTQNDNGALLSIASFSGSVRSVLVGSIVYTASCENFTEYETIYRFEDGDNAPGVFVTANTNQFIYKATDLSLNPTGQVITLEAKRKNLASATTPLTVNSGSGKPPLTLVSTNATNGVDTYTLAGSSYSYGVGESIYYISGSDQFGNQFSDSIKITPVKILDGLSATLTNDNASLPALSNGFVASGSFILTSGSVTVKVGNESILFDDDNDSVRANNTFAITNLSGTGCTPNGGNNSNPSTNAYSITNLTADSGSLDITINYKDGAGDTTSIVKTATYTKNKKAAPVLTFVIGNNNQSTDAKSTGAQIGAFSDSSLSVKEQYNGATSTLTLSSAPTINSSSVFPTITKTTTNLTYPSMDTNTDSVELSVTGSVTDSEGVSRNVFGSVSLTKIKKAAPVLAITSTPRNQTVTAKSTGVQLDPFVDVSVIVKETYNGSSSNLTLTSLTATSTDISNIATSAASGLVRLVTDPINGLRVLPNGVDSTTITITAVVTDTEGVSRTLTDTVSLSKVKKAVPNIIVTATPQAQSVLANSAGTQTGTLTNVTISALEGTTSRFDAMTATYTGFSTNPNIGGNNNILNTSAAVMNAAEASATIVVSYTDSEGTIGSQTIVVRFTKVNTGTKGDNGTNGDPGAPGADGRRTATGLLYYQLSAATAPATPSATSYTFSTNTFAGLTANWALGAPTFAAGNSNKYWYSTYTAVETTAGGNTATPTFSTVTQAIGFTGLVTFTSANNISDGSNSSNIVTPGAVTNHIGGANVTTIDGGKISTGIITSTGYTLLGADTLASGSFLGAGTIFNLDNGSLRSKNFYINQAGNAFFKGDISGASGTFSGNLSGATITGGTITVGTGDGRVIISTQAFGDRYDDTENDRTITIGPGGIIIKGDQNSSQQTPISYISMQQVTDSARMIIASYNLGVEPLAVQGFPTGNSSATVNIYNGGIQARNYSTTAYGTTYPGTGNGGYAITSYGNFYCSGAGEFVGDVTANTSDRRLKKNIVKIDSPLEKISKINGVYFNWNETAKKLADKDTEIREIGFIAQDIQSVLPEIIKPAPFDIEMDESITDKVVYKSKTGENYLTIQYEKIVPLLVECIKELKSEIEELKRNR